MTLSETMAEDLLTIEADLENQVFTWSGEDYLCVPSTDERLIESDSQRGNFLVQRVLTITVRSNLFADSIFPSSNEVIQYKSASYKIANVKKSPNGALLTITCVGTTRA